MPLPLLLVLVALAGMIFGIGLMKVAEHHIHGGTVHVDCSDHDGQPYVFLEAAKNPKQWLKYRYVRFRVKLTNLTRVDRDR